MNTVNSALKKLIAQHVEAQIDASWAGANDPREAAVCEAVAISAEEALDAFIAALAIKE